MPGRKPRSASLGRKVPILILAVLILVGAAQTVALGVSLNGWFEELEARETRAAAARIMAAFEAERSALALLTLDYAAWDDARDYILGKQPDFADENFIPRWAENSELASILVLSADAKILWSGRTEGGAFARSDGSEKRKTFEPLARARTDGPWFDVEAGNGEALLLCAQPITNSEYSAPAAGWILFARAMDGRMIERISEKAGLAAAFVPASEDIRALGFTAIELPNGGQDSSAGEGPGASSGAAFRDEDSVRHIRLSLRNSEGGEAAAIEACMDRMLLVPERRLLWRLTIYLAVTALIATGVLLAALRGLALLPLAAMAARLNELAGKPALGARIGLGAPKGRTDEIGIVSDRIDSLLDALETERGLLERANEELERVAQIDFLTGLPNRRRLEDYADREVRRISRELRGNDKKGFIAVLIADIDHFKLFNDLYGHLKGDECLKSIAEAIDGAVHRPSDLPCRFGGEEFLILLPETDLAGALRVAENLMKAIHGIAFPFPDSPVRPIVTLSIGAAAGRVVEGFNLKSIVQNADEAMYAAKRSGRDSIKASDDAA